jgi:hypothetical protein
MTGAAGPAAVTDEPVDQQKSQTEVEQEESRRQAAYRHTRLSGSPSKNDGTTNVIPFGPTGNTSVQGGGGTGTTGDTGSTGNTGPTATQPWPDASEATQSSTNLSLDFLDDFFGADKRHLVAIKKQEGKKPEIKARHFDAGDRAGQQKFISDHGDAGFDLYFSPNPIKGKLHKKATKNDVAEAHHLWIDLDPRPGEPLDGERAAILALLTTNLPKGVPKPNRVIDSGRGFWGYWKLATPQPVDGSNGPLTEVVECYGRGIEQAFGDRFADGCRNIDRISRLPGTTNTKTGRPAHVLPAHSNDTPHAIETFPQSIEQPKDQGAPRGEKFRPPEKYESIGPDDPLLAKLDAKWLTMLTAADYAAGHGGDRSRAEIAFAAVAMRVGIDDDTIARCLMDERRQFGSNTRAAQRLLNRVIEKAHQYADDPVLEQMNGDFAAGFIGSKFRVARFDRHQRYPLQRDVEFLSKDDFINGVRNPPVQVPKLDKAGKPDGTKMEPRGAYWFGLSGRSEFDAVTFKPGDPPIIEVERAGRVHRTINTYSGFSVMPDHVDSAAKCAKYLAHVHDNIAGADEALYSYLLDWMASGVKHPDNPGRSALSLRGVPGCGKGVFALGYGRLFGKHFLHATHRDHVVGRFNAHQAETCLIFVDEALYAEIAADAQILKTMTSETTKLLERKGIDAIQIDNFARQIFSTNDEHPIQIEHNDRRYPAVYVQENKAFANEIDELIKAEKRKTYFMPILDELKNGGSEALLGFLLDRDIRGFNAEAIPETAERREQKLNSASAGDKIIIEFAQDACLPGALAKRPWIARAHGNPRFPRNHQAPGLYDEIKTRGGTKLAHKSDTDLAKTLKAWGFKSKSLGSSRGWEAPPLLEMRKAILAKYPAVEFDDRTEWVAGDAFDDADQGPVQPAAVTPADVGRPDGAPVDDAGQGLVQPAAATMAYAPNDGAGQGPGQPAAATRADVGQPDEADLTLDEKLKRIRRLGGTGQTAAIQKLARDKTLF